jgi:hypothetical protein
MINKKTMKNIMLTSAGLMVGGAAMGALGGMMPDGPGQQIVSNVGNTAIGIGALGIPLAAAGMVMKATDELPRSKKKGDLRDLF